MRLTVLGRPMCAACEQAKVLVAHLGEQAEYIPMHAGNTLAHDMTTAEGLALLAWHELIEDVEKSGMPACLLTDGQGSLIKSWLGMCPELIEITNLMEG